MLCATLSKILKTPSGKETSLQSDKSAEGKAWLLPFIHKTAQCLQSTVRQSIFEKNKTEKQISDKNLYTMSILQGTMYIYD